MNMQQQPQPQPVSKPTTPFKFRLIRRKTPVFSTGKPLATRGLEAPKSSADPADPRVIRIGVRQGWPDYDELAAENWPCAEKSDEVMSILWFLIFKLQKHGTEHCFDFLVPRQLRQGSSAAAFWIGEVRHKP